MKRTFRHVLCSLRERLGHLTQKELATYAGTSTWTIQAIELGKLKLSQKLAFRISQATGVDYGWLLENDLSQPPVNQRREPYSESDLIRAQVKNVKQDGISLPKGKIELTQAYYYLRLIWEKLANDPDELSFFLFRLKQFVDSECRRTPVPKLQQMTATNPAVGLLVSIDPGGKLNVLRSTYPYPSVILVAPESFDVMESDAYECRKSLEYHRYGLDEEAHPQGDQPTETASSERSTVKRPRAQAKPRRLPK